MKNYALLINPGHNRVYFDQSIKLSASELQIASMRMSESIEDIRIESIADIPYLVFSCSSELNRDDIRVISRLSFVYSIYEIKQAATERLLLPIMRTNTQFANTNISSILKYTGKTNEIFTRMLINIAHFTSDFGMEEDIRLLDPVAGKGTTLFEGLIYGYDVYGIEIGDKAVSEACGYMKKYLETERYKHSFKSEKLSGPNKSFIAVRNSFDIAKSKEELKENRQKHLEIISGNSMYADKYFRKNQFHIIVGDLPYGVMHGNVTNEKQSSLTRNPKELLSSCLGSWREVLKQGGAVVLAWNKFVLPKDEINRIMESAGFHVLNDGAYMSFEHRVDQAILRDIVVAKKI